MQCCASVRGAGAPTPTPTPTPTPPPLPNTPSVTRERVRLLGGRHVRSAGRACVSGCALPKA